MPQIEITAVSDKPPEEWPSQNGHFRTYRVKAKVDGNPEAIHDINRKLSGEGGDLVGSVPPPAVGQSGEADAVLPGRGEFPPKIKGFKPGGSASPSAPNATPASSDDGPNWPLKDARIARQAAWKATVELLKGKPLDDGLVKYWIEFFFQDYLSVKLPDPTGGRVETTAQPGSDEAIPF